MKSLTSDPGVKSNVMLYFEPWCHKFYYLKLYPSQKFFKIMDVGNFSHPRYFGKRPLKPE